MDENPGGQIKAFLDYVQGNRTAGGLVEEIEAAVERARAHKEWEVEYMTWQAFEMDARRRGVQKDVRRGVQKELSGAAGGIRLVMRLL